MAFLQEYAPKTIDDIVFGSEATKNTIRRMVSGDIAPQHMLLYGPPGTGKSSAAYLVAAALNKAREVPPEFIMAASRSTTVANLIDFLDIQKNLYWHSHDLIGPIVIDEVDNLRGVLLDMLGTRLRKDQAVTTPIIMTTNYVHKIDIRIRSRALQLAFPYKGVDHWFPRLKQIAMAANKMNVSDEQLRAILQNSGGDFAQALIQLEST